ncbi:hypothetical protein EXIGLDRAFT_759377 [Exidia glandulosa HHB12029]|uniref:Uncharacterized protein n=1 Tax=Exidia glandulosa HHB12029 TaxID=1314781 RepID=A0A165Q4K1_EXIGL|nr:hypothetical protein EXIGLDRAFT_759377 [Exidia glandulosa HHB12029]
MQTSTAANRTTAAHTVTDTGGVEYLTTMLNIAKKEQEDVARNKPLPPLPPTDADITDEYETTETPVAGGLTKERLSKLKSRLL